MLAYTHEDQLVHFKFAWHPFMSSPGMRGGRQNPEVHLVITDVVLA